MKYKKSKKLYMAVLGTLFLISSIDRAADPQTEIKVSITAKEPKPSNWAAIGTATDNIIQSNFCHQKLNQNENLFDFITYSDL